MHLLNMRALVYASGHLRPVRKASPLSPFFKFSKFPQYILGRYWEHVTDYVIILPPACFAIEPVMDISQIQNVAFSLGESFEYDLIHYLKNVAFFQYATNPISQLFFLFSVLYE